MSFKVTINPKGLEFSAEADEDLISAAAKAGIKFTRSCENGVCEVCKAHLVAGAVSVPEGNFDASHKHVNPLLPCVSRARSDLILELEKVLGPGEVRPQHIAFQVQNVTNLSEDVFRIELLSPAGKIPEFHAGQYLELLIDGNEYPYTIANAPGSRIIELHLGTSTENDSSFKVLQYLKSQPTVRARLPKGNVWISKQNIHDPLVFVVAGTGFAQAKAIIEEQISHQHCAIYLYWINRNASGFYSDIGEQWVVNHAIRYRKMTPDDPTCEFYNPAPVQDLINQDLADLSNIKVIACGGPNFVYSVLDGLELNGLSPSQMLSDVFAYAPRPAKK